MEDNKNVMLFAAIDKVAETNIPQLTEVEGNGKGYILYGKDNLYPEYLYGLYTDVSTLKTIIAGTAEYVSGDDAICNVQGFEDRINKKGDTARELITLLAKDWLIYGGYAVQVIRNNAGRISELYYIDFRYVRSDKFNEVIYYSQEFGKKYGRSSKMLVYPSFIPDAVNVPTSILYVKNEKSHTYPIPRYSGAIKACEIERSIDNMHLNSLENGFMPSFVLNMMNGIPTDEQADEIEKNVNEKFCGSANAGRVLINFANGKDNAASVEKLDIVDFGEKYKAASDRSREQIYCAFQAVPQLFGLTSAATGFSEQEFKEAFNLYNKTVVRGIQRGICDNLDKIFGMKGSMSITPFSIDNNAETNVN